MLLTPIAPVFARLAGASDVQVKRDLSELPALLDEVDRLLAQGVIGSDQPNEADFQIASSLRTLLAMRDIGPLLSGRPSETFALAVLPEYPDIPAALPTHWIPTSTSSAPTRRGGCSCSIARSGAITWPPPP